jgi:hypothetical protein
MKTKDGFYKVFICPRCERQFRAKVTARRHIFFVHLRQGVSCAQCSSHFFNANSLRLHRTKCDQVHQERTHLIKYIHKDEERRLKVMIQPQPHRRSILKAETQTETGTETGKSLTTFRIPWKNFRVRNPFPNFHLKTALSVKVSIEPLQNFPKTPPSSKESPPNFPSSSHRNLLEKQIPVGEPKDEEIQRAAESSINQ